MSSRFNQHRFRLLIDGSESELQVLSFVGREALNQPFSFELELVSRKTLMELDDLLHKLAFLETHGEGNGFHGQVYSFGCTETGGRLTRYRLTLRPRLAYLKHRLNRRIFQHLTVPQIIAQVLDQHGIREGAYSFALARPYPQRDYCVQYDESDLHFIQRLCEEEGIHYHFQHSTSGHMLAFGEDQTVFRKLPATAFHFDSGLEADEATVNRFGVRLTTRTTRVARRDYDFAFPGHTLRADSDAGARPELEDYGYPGRFTDRDRGARLASRALERHRSDLQVAEGHSNQPTLTSGHFLALQGHSMEAWNQLWLLTEVHHEGRQPQVLTEHAGSATDNRQGFTQGYRNRFTAIPWDAAYRPPLKHSKPHLPGSQNAVVTGPGDEEIHCDELGRVKVQFFWDRDGQGDNHSSCWLRVASTWAGQQMGALALPRVGMEVLVSFLEGDPDQPLITGCLYNGAHRPPYKLPDFKTLSILKTKEHQGSRSNELRIDDTSGQISATLRSDHGASAINLGYLTHPRPSGGEPRGEGFELRTDHHGAVRAAAGLLITTEPRLLQARHHKDLAETTERLAVACDQQNGFATQARHCLAQESGDQDEVADALHSQQAGISGTGGERGEFADPHLVLASPAGIALTTPGPAHIATGGHLALSSTGHTSLAIGKRLLASASRGIRVFAQSLGLRLIAASGDIDLRALKDSINLLAKLDITASADCITLSAKTRLVIQGGGSSSTYSAAGITHATAGTYTAHAADFAWTGAKSTTASFPEPPKHGQGNLELFNRYANQHGINGAFEVIDAAGVIHKGMLNAKGFAAIAGAAPGPATVTFGADTTNPWAESSHAATADWPPLPLSAGELPDSAGHLVAKVLQHVQAAEIALTPMSPSEVDVSAFDSVEAPAEITSDSPVSAHGTGEQSR